MKKIQITLQEELYRELLSASEESMRPLATEAVYRIKLGLEPRVKEASKDILEELRELESRGSSVVAEVKEDYSELVEKIGNSFERELGFEERQELNREIKAAGLVWNSYAKRLEKSEGGKFKLIHQF